MVPQGIWPPNRRGLLLRTGGTIVVTILCLAQSVIGAEPRVLIGRVTDEVGHPLPWGNVVIPGTTVGAFVGEEGIFRLRLPPEPAESLRATMISYRDTTVAIPRSSEADTLHIVLRSRFSFLGDPGAAQELVRAIRSSTTVEAYLVDYPRYPAHDVANFRGYPIRTVATPPSPRALAELCQLLLEASRDSCGSGPSMCVFQPRYAFRFHDQPRPLELLVSGNCQDLAFSRGPDWASSGSGGGYDCVRIDIQATMAGIFGEALQK